MWEYDIRGLWHFEDYGENLYERKLNEHGEKGWELVQIIGDKIIFKRKTTLDESK